MTYYERGYLCGVVRDPKPKQGEAVRFYREQFLKTYYRPVFETFLECGAGIRLEGERAEAALALPCFTQEEKEGEERTLHFGMPKTLFRRLMEEDYGFLEEQDNELWREFCPQGAFMGKDGIYIR